MPERRVLTDEEKAAYAAKHGIGRKKKVVKTSLLVALGVATCVIVFGVYWVVQMPQTVKSVAGKYNGIDYGTASPIASVEEVKGYEITEAFPAGLSAFEQVEATLTLDGSPTGSVSFYKGTDYMQYNGKIYVHKPMSPLYSWALAK